MTTHRHYRGWNIKKHLYLVKKNIFQHFLLIGTLLIVSVLEPRAEIYFLSSPFTFFLKKNIMITQLCFSPQLNSEIKSHVIVSWYFTKIARSPSRVMVSKFSLPCSLRLGLQRNDELQRQPSRPPCHDVVGMHAGSGALVVLILLSLTKIRVISGC